MAMGNFQVGDVGTVIELDVQEDGAPVDISQATVKQFVFLLPNGAFFSRTAVFKNTGSDGKLIYTTVADDLSVPGNWRVQAYVTMPDGFWHTRAVGFYVASNLV
jgi:hypothetical protein